MSVLTVIVAKLSSAAVGKLICRVLSDAGRWDVRVDDNSAIDTADRIGGVHRQVRGLWRSNRFDRK